MPDSDDKLLRLAAELGYLVERTTRGGAHVFLRHPSTGATCTVPLRVAGPGRDYHNYRQLLRRHATNRRERGPVGPDEARPAADSR